MVKLLSPKEKIEELFETIKSSQEYKNYMEIKKIIEDNDEINSLVNEIKRLQQKSVKLEAKKDDSYKDVDRVIDEKVSQLNLIPLYQEYTRRMN